MPLPLRIFDYKISIHALRVEGDNGLNTRDGVVF